MSIANVNDARKKMTNALTSLNKLGNGQTWINGTKKQMKNTIGRLNRVAEHKNISRNNSAMIQPTQPTKMIIKKNMFGQTRYYTPSVNGGGYTQVRKNYQYNKNIRTAPARAVRSTYRAVKNKRAAVSSKFAGITSYLSNAIAQRANRIAKAAANTAAKTAAARNAARNKVNRIRMQRNATATRRAQNNATRF
jgi:hypothetical protein